MTQADKQIADYLARPLRYANIDGTGEMALGVFLTGAAVYYSLPPALRRIVWVPWVALLLLVCHYLPKAIKRKITYRRTGYVSNPRMFGTVFGGVDGKTARIRSMVATALLVALMSAGAALAVRHAHGKPGALSVAGPAWAIIMACGYAWHFARRERWKWLIALPMAIGSAFLPALGLTWWDTLQVTFGIVGVCLLLSGIITLVLYIRRTHAPEPEAE